jgi:hypothetical protein
MDKKKYALEKNVFLEDFPRGAVALVKQRNGKYRIIVSRPPNEPDAILARAETELVDLISFEPCSKNIFEDDDD